MGRDPGGPAEDGRRVRETVSRMVAGAHQGLTPLQVARSVAMRLGVSKAAVRREVYSLVCQGRLAFSQRYGASYLEPAVCGPRRISRRVWICPPRCTLPAERSADRVVIRIRPGAAFGIGDHPTTRLALRGLACVWENGRPSSVLDIGTGTGILAIAAALFGAERVLATDIDPCARAESVANIDENGLTGSIEVTDCPLERIGAAFSMVTANLRPPTLAQLAAVIDGITLPEASAVLSGFRPEEWPPLEALYRRHRWQAAWMEEQNGWAAVVCRKQG